MPKDPISLKEKLEKTHSIKIMNIYGFGSYYLGTFTKKSDRDYVIICHPPFMGHQLIRGENYDLSAYSLIEFKVLLNRHDGILIEAFHHPIYQEEEIRFEVNKTLVKYSFLLHAEYIYMKAKRLLEKESPTELDIYRAKKSLFHSIRVLDFGIQLYLFGEIMKWTHLRVLFREIMEESNSWPICERKYGPMFQYNKQWLIDLP